ncbi:MAG: RDD family protein [Planctomycetes bacterium]|nr:RDD family protein [Planctomycetota bacterium]
MIESEEIAYPRLIRRVQAVLIDSLIVPIAVIISIFVSNKIGITENWVKALVIIGPVFILEPLLVSLTGGTIGHHAVKIKVRNINRDENINIILAVVRFIVKVILGWVSVFFILITKRHQAIHDYLVRSIVVHKYSHTLPKNEIVRERKIDDKYLYPTTLRKIIIIVLYLFMSVLAFGVVVNLLLSDTCLLYEACTDNENIVIIVMNVVILSAIGGIIYFGWRSRLIGCRRKLKETN